MKNDIFEFSVKTKGNADPKGKPRVYFTCHPADFGRAFDKICADLFATHDCAVYYTENMTQEVPADNRETDLEHMNLFVIPVSFRLLTQPSRAMDSDFPFAKDKHIPVLPILLENGIDEFYSRPDKFGALQYLNPYSSDMTEISYAEKLKKYLESVLIGDELAKRIRAAFDAFIFLSYRKKDRRLANQLMRLIHSRPELRDIAIWYDEFLTPGESFKENIDQMLHNSRLFTLLVTPRLLEEPNGMPNYVMGTEYPAARIAGIEILPAEMESTDRDELLKKYAGLPECLQAGDEAMYQRLLISLNDTAKRENDNEPEHDYLIGLAYLDGIDVETDREKGLNLITSAAENGLLEAMEKLADLYATGAYASLDYDKAYYWQRKAVDLHQIRYNCDPSFESLSDLVRAQHILSQICHHGSFRGRNEAFVECQEKNIQLLQQSEALYHRDERHALAVAFGSLGHFYLVNIPLERFDLAVDYYQRSLALKQQLAIENKIDDYALGLTWRNLGDSYMWNREDEKAEEALLRALQFYDDVDEKAPFSLFVAKIDTIGLLGRLYIRQHKFKEAIRWYKHVTLSLGLLYEANGDPEIASTLHYYLIELANAQKYYDKQTAEPFFENALALLKKLTLTSIEDWSRFKEAGILRKKAKDRLTSYSVDVDSLTELCLSLKHNEKAQKAHLDAAEFFESLIDSLQEDFPVRYYAAMHYRCCGNILSDLKCFEAAEQHYSRAFQMVNGGDMSELTTQYAAAEVYQDYAQHLYHSGHEAEAELPCQEALKIRQAIYEDIPNKYTARMLLLSLRRLGQLYDVFEKYESAKEVYEAIYQIRMTHFGKQDSGTRASMKDLASVYHDLGEHEKEAGILKELVSISGEVTGPNHPDTLAVKVDLARTLDELGETDAALRLCDEVLPLKKQLTTNCIKRIVAIYERHGQQEKAAMLRGESAD